MLTLLSPAKSLDFEPLDLDVAATQPRFGHDTRVLGNRCKKLGTRALRKLMDLSQPLAELNHERFQKMTPPPYGDDASFQAPSQAPSQEEGGDGSKPCLFAFQGDVYKGLDASSLSSPELAWAQDHLRILSGLYGILRPLDRIQPYRLEMGARLRNTRGRNLYEFWGDRLVDSLNAENRERPGSAVLNLASNEYFRAVRAKKLEPRLVTAVFQEIRGGEPRTISFFAKRARGLMARHIVEQRIERPEDLRTFSSEGYGFRSDLSSDDHLVFTRDRG